MLHSAELHVLLAMTLTNDGVAGEQEKRSYTTLLLRWWQYAGRIGVARPTGAMCQTARALEQKIHPSSHDLLHPLLLTI